MQVSFFFFSCLEYHISAYELFNVICRWLHTVFLMYIYNKLHYLYLGRNYELSHSQIKLKMFTRFDLLRQIKPLVVIDFRALLGRASVLLMLSFKSYKHVAEGNCLWNSDRGQEEECVVVESDLRNVQ